MINEHHQEQAALYVLGAMEPSLCASFEKEIAADPDIRQRVDELRGIVAGMSVALSAKRQPSPELKGRILSKIGVQPDEPFEEGESALDSLCPPCYSSIAEEKEGIVVTNKDGLVEWINETQAEMCGFSLEEVRGKKLGPLLQGSHTDPQAVQNMRDAIQHHRYITQEILNYHKNGTPYWVSLTISPVMDSENQVRSFIAIEREIKGRPLPVD